MAHLSLLIIYERYINSLHDFSSLDGTVGVGGHGDTDTLRLTHLQARHIIVLHTSDGLVVSNHFFNPWAIVVKHFIVNDIGSIADTFYRVVHLNADAPIKETLNPSALVR